MNSAGWSTEELPPPPLREWPQVDPAWSVDESNVTVVTVVLFVVVATFLAWTIQLWRRTGNPIGIVMILAAPLGIALEAPIDLLGMAWHPENQPMVITVLGRGIPVWELAIYMIYMGAFSVVVWRRLQSGCTPRAVWQCYIGALIADALIESVCLPLRIWYYYGEQPLRFWDTAFPLWWGPCNALVPIIGGYLLYWFSDRLRGRNLVFLLPIPTWTVMVSYAICAWPVWAVINTDLDWWATWPFGVLPHIFGVMSVWALLRLDDWIQRARKIDAAAPDADQTAVTAAPVVGS